MMTDRLVLDLDIAERRGERRGKRRGERRGERRGKKQLRNEVALEMLKAGESLDKILLFTHISTERLQALQDSLAKSESTFN
ncbi:MAG: hypothetical protein LBS62_00930 [Clostridiales bacterium]|jgi:predicted transposase YdaD|nr:hypothetical protein [Clostridiales bacterium]